MRISYLVEVYAAKSNAPNQLTWTVNLKRKTIIKGIVKMLNQIFQRKRKTLVKLWSSYPQMEAGDGLSCLGQRSIIIYPVVQTFALLYKDKFANIGMSATDSSIIINVNSAFGMGLDYN
uniref:(California timema) hypothetical protein n=1 Tax=Timema californicum TaxID=61474 RepID=A0A7R9JG58_TIMCA|nr:unnamed protein product [Timema californicum]